MKLHILSISAVFTLFSLGHVPAAIAEDLEHTQQLLSTQQCPGCNLSRAGLVYANLSNADLSDANLSQANLSRSNLSGANLSGANLAGAVLFNTNLSGADLSGANLAGADLRGAILSGANLQGAIVDEANFLGAVGLPSEVATVENLYRLGLAEAERGNHRGAISHFSQVITLEPEFANAYLARSVSLFRLANQSAALEDANQAQQLYLSQGNQEGYQAATQLADGIQAFQEANEAQQEEFEGNGIGTGLLSLMGTIASLLLRFGLP